MTLSIDIVSDVVCPWCYVGKRHLEGALSRYAKERPASPPFVVTWQPFQLNPDLPEEGMSRATYIARKFGPRAPAVYQRIAAIGDEVGIAFAVDRITRQPNTVAAHSLIEAARSHGKEDAMVEALFRAYFLDGVDLTVRENLVAVALGAGLDDAIAAQWLANPESRARVKAGDARMRRIGIDGVPCFIFNGRRAIQGAQPAETLLAAMMQAERDALQEAPRKAPM